MVNQPEILLQKSYLDENKPNHQRYILEFRTEQCKLFLEQQCQYHRPYTCFNWHFPNQKRRRPTKRSDGTFNYNPDVYCDKYDENTGTCPNGEDCLYAHRNAGDTEKRYHPRYFKTGNCIFETTENGSCVKNGLHCAFAHGIDDLRQPTFDIREVQDSLTKFSINLPACLEKERVLSEDPKWKDMFHVLSCYKTEFCKKPPRMCRQGYSCPFFHNGKDKRRPPNKFKYKSTPCPTVRPSEEWLDSSLCENGDDCQYCHTRTEQQFHPEIYNSSKCNDVINSGYCPRGPFCAFAHMENEMNIGRDFMMAVQMKLNNFVGPLQWIPAGSNTNLGHHQQQYSKTLLPGKDVDLNKTLDLNYTEYQEREKIKDFSPMETHQEDFDCYLKKNLMNENPRGMNTHRMIPKHSMSPMSMRHRQTPTMIPITSESSFDSNNTPTSGHSFLLHPTNLSNSRNNLMSPLYINPPMGNQQFMNYGGSSLSTPSSDMIHHKRLMNENSSLVGPHMRKAHQIVLQSGEMNSIHSNYDAPTQLSESSSGSHSTSPWPLPPYYYSNDKVSPVDKKNAIMYLFNNCFNTHNPDKIKLNLLEAYSCILRINQTIIKPQDIQDLKDSFNNIDKNNINQMAFRGSTNGVTILEKAKAYDDMKRDRDNALEKLSHSITLIKHLLNENQNFHIKVGANLDGEKGDLKNFALSDELKDQDIMDILGSSTSIPDVSKFNNNFDKGLIKEEELSPRQMAFLFNSPWSHDGSRYCQQQNSPLISENCLFNQMKGDESTFGTECYDQDECDSVSIEPERLLEQRYIQSGRPKNSFLSAASGLTTADSGCLDLDRNIDIYNFLSNNISLDGTEKK